MKHFLSLDNIRQDGVWLTIGSFDGVHLGHQEIIKKLTAGAHKEGVSAVVLTFHPHPATILRGRDFPFYLSTPDEKANLMGDLGVDIVITHPFDRKLAATSAREFMEIINRQLGLRQLHVGHDFALGRNREGDVQTLTEIGEELDYSVQQIEPLKFDGQIVSSSRIRFLLGVGQIEKAARLLNRNYTLDGLVVMGDQRGRTIGFPTANLDIWKMRAIPAAGVYVCRAFIDQHSYGAVTNIGVRPTFETNPVSPTVETHILDFQGDLYGKPLRLEFLSRLRGEQRFSSAEDLIAQIHRDIIRARKVLA